jgi:hypothetical protein
LVFLLKKSGIVQPVVLQQMDKCGAEIEEMPPQMRWEPPARRVEAMFEQIDSKLKDPEFLLCILPEKNCDIYGLSAFLALQISLFNST